MNASFQQERRTMIILNISHLSATLLVGTD